MPLLRVVPWAMWGALAIFSVATYSSLPSEIAQHFNAAGEVTSTTPKSLLSWLMVPGIALLTMAGLSWLSSLLERQPGLFNFPEKERFLKIPAAYRGPVIVRMRETLDVTNIFVALVFCVVQLMIWRAGLGDSASGYSIGLIVGTVLFTPLVLLMTSRVNSAVDEAEKRWKASERKA